MSRKQYPGLLWSNNTLLEELRRALGLIALTVKTQMIQNSEQRGRASRTLSVRPLGHIDRGSADEAARLRHRLSDCSRLDA